MLLLLKKFFIAHHLKRLKERILLKLFKKIVWNWRGVIVTVPSVAGLIIGLRLVGWLQPLEWAALDAFFQLRPLEPPDERVLIVGIEESDIQKLGQWPMSDQVLASLLNKIKQQRPRAIGLDLYRDLPVQPGHEELLKVFKSTPNLIGIQKVIEDTSSKENIFSSKINPPPELKRLGQLSASDFVVDGDGVVRRSMLFPIPDKEEATPSLGLAVAATYLKEEGITPTAANNGFMQLGKTVFIPFKTNDGSYIRADAGGYQILLNFRGPHNFPQVSLSSVLENRIAPDLFRDRIVLIGSQATSINDAFSTPYTKKIFTNIEDLVSTPIRTPGVEVQANVASEILSSVLDNRPLIKVWSDLLEALWITFWTTLPAVLGWELRSINNTKNFSVKFLLSMFVAVSTATMVLVVSSYLAFLISLWIPVIPPLLAMFCSSFIIIVYAGYSKLEETNITLELKVDERTQQLKDKNEQLRHAFKQLKATQKQIIAREKLTFFSTLTAGIAYEVRDPLNYINNFAVSSVDLSFELQEKIKATNLQCLVSKQNGEDLDKILFKLIEDILKIKQESQVITKNIQKLLLHSQQEASKQKLTNVNDLVDSSVKLVYCSFKSKYDVNICVETEYDISIEEIEIVVQDISRVLIDVIDSSFNSVYQKMKIFGEAFSPKIYLQTRQLNNSVNIEIRDNGLGITSDISDRILDLFFTSKYLKKGPDLGFYISRDIIREYGGEIKLETEPGVYTELVLILPKESVLK